MTVYFRNVFIGMGVVHKALLAVSVPMCRVVPARVYSPWVRYNLERAGCLYTKIGQWMSSRTDLFPLELTTELQKLQTSAHPMSTSTVTGIVSMSEFEFDQFDTTPLSCGSIAHVHRAVYRGEEVAVKIQRPGLIEDMDRDMRLVTTVLQLLSGQESRVVDDLLKTLTELVESVRKETDFIEEGNHMTRYRTFFNGSIRVPRVIASTPSVLVMEYVPSDPYTGDASVLMKLFYDQFFEFGYLHTDLHAGNLGVDGGGTMVLYDFGSVIRIPSSTVLGMKALIVAYLNKNTTLMLQYMFEYGIMESRHSEVPSEEVRMLEMFIENVLSYIEVTDMDQFATMMKSTPMTSSTCSFSDHIFIIVRSFTLMEGYCKKLDPNFVILEAAMPLAKSFAQDPMFVALKIEDDLRHLDSMFRRSVQ